MLHQTRGVESAKQAHSLWWDRVSIRRKFLNRYPLSLSPKQIDDLVLAGARRVLARAANSRSLDAQILSTRLRTAIDKYIFKHDTSADARTIDNFVDTLHADDLCLVIACERADEQAWNDLFEGYGATVRSAARAASSN